MCEMTTGLSPLMNQDHIFSIVPALFDMDLLKGRVLTSLKARFVELSEGNSTESSISDVLSSYFKQAE